MSKKTTDCELPMPAGTYVEFLGPDLALLAIPVAAPRLPPCLTPAEQAIARLLCEGASNDEVARRRGVSRKTIGNQLEAIYRKLNVASRAELVRALLR